MSYHINEIKKGVVGEISKIREEFDELEDALLQNNKIMILCELSDIYLAMERYLENRMPNFNMNDLRIMAGATKRAFDSGHRK